MNKENVENAAKLSYQASELKTKLERLEERYVLEEIAQDLFLKYKMKFSVDLLEIEKQMKESTLQVSNPEHNIERALDRALNLPQAWYAADYKDKVKLQNQIFPEGISYNKKTGECRTTRINAAFLWIALQSQALAKNKIGIPELKFTYPKMVDATGLEPVTPTLSR